MVRRATIIAFFPVTPKELENRPDANEALSDFQFYAAQARKPLLQMGVDLEEVYGRSFRVTNSRKTTTFRPASGKIGYYLVTPSKRPRIEYGVETDIGLMQAAREYFGLVAKSH